MPPASFRTALLTAGALVAFASNSLLCRAALGARLIDAASFTAIRLAAGAVALVLLARSTRRPEGGSWTSAGMLFVYAVAFSFAYLRIGAGIGALILFGAVQLTMIGWGLWAGERPHALEIVGLVLALAGLAVLTLPGAHAVDLLGAVLMAGAGAAWGGYSLRGRGSTRPISANADNFLRSLPLAAALALGLGVRARVSWSGAALAAASGALASAVGYSIWYAALRGLSATRAAIVQLPVPVLTAAGAVLVLGESVTLRFVVAAGAIIGGVAIALFGRR